MTLTLILALALATPQTPPAQDGKTPFKLGVVNLKTCFDKEKHERVKDVDLELQKNADEFKKKIEDIDRKISSLKDRIENLPAASTLRADLSRDLQRAITDRKFEAEYGRLRYLDFYNDRKVEIYNEIRRVVDMVASEQKFDLVLRVEAPQLEEDTRETPTAQIASRVVLYHHKNVDITDDVIKRLNDEYKKEKAAGPKKKDEPKKDEPKKEEPKKEEKK
jgi:Skp family chaperone for outer membrane proteins